MQPDVDFDALAAQPPAQPQAEPAPVSSPVDAAPAAADAQAAGMWADGSAPVVATPDLGSRSRAPVVQPGPLQRPLTFRSRGELIVDLLRSPDDLGTGSGLERLRRGGA